MTREMMQLINGSLCANIGFVDENGKPNIRRVYCTWHKGIGGHLISSNVSSRHVQSLLKNSDACLYFENSERFKGICLNGKVIVHCDREFKEMLWMEGDEQYYPNGIDDEDYCVLEFIAESGRFFRYEGSVDLTGENIRENDKDTQWADFYSRFI